MCTANNRKVRNLVKYYLSNLYTASAPIPHSLLKILALLLNLWYADKMLLAKKSSDKRPKMQGKQMDNGGAWEGWET